MKTKIFLGVFLLCVAMLISGCIKGQLTGTAPECSDRIDNDKDGYCDYKSPTGPTFTCKDRSKPGDMDCLKATQNSEKKSITPADPIVKRNCTDSDGGYNIYQKGTLTAPNTIGQKTDYCSFKASVGKDVLMEYYCLNETSGTIEYDIQCPQNFVCKDGACVQNNTDECISKGFVCTSQIRGCGQYQEKPYSCPSGSICCENIPTCGDGVCFVHNTPGYGETPETCPQDCACTDSDNGANYNVKGTTTGPSPLNYSKIEMTDHCYMLNQGTVESCDSTTNPGQCGIIEYDCLWMSGTPSYMKFVNQKAFYSCPGGCNDGKCTGTVCVPKTCSELGYTCGFVSDGCGKIIECGSCTSDKSCFEGKCYCDSFPPCYYKQIECGTLTNSCGNSIDCGECGTGQTCENNHCIGPCVDTDGGIKRTVYGKVVGSDCVAGTVPAPCFDYCSGEYESSQWITECFIENGVVKAYDDPCPGRCVNNACLP